MIRPLSVTTLLMHSPATPERSMQHPLPLTAVVVTKNEADRIARCLGSLVPLCSEVIVLDSGSQDATVEIARHLGVRVCHQEWLGFAEQKNAAIKLASQPWVLLLDADEWLGEGAEASLRRLFDTSAVEAADVWRLQRRTHFLGTALNHGGWGNESVERLFRAGLRYRPAQVHESLDLRGRRVDRVPARIEHDTARTLEEYQTKLEKYATLWASQRMASGRRCGPVSAYTHAMAYWVKNYLMRGGFLDGSGARTYHALHTKYVLEKYQQLHERGKPARE